jgi:hypothetical protein
VKESYVYEQKPVSGRPILVSPEQAQSIVTRFKEAYSKLGNPRILIYVNRELVDEESGAKLSARRQEVEAVRGNVKREAASGTATTAAVTNAPTITGSVVIGDIHTGPGGNTPGSVNGEVEKVTTRNAYRIRDRKTASLADRQTVRDVERLFGRPLRTGGAALADQRVATQLIADRELKSFAVPTEGEQARKDREALGRIADVVLEVLISSRTVTVSEISGDRTMTVPDIQATAIRLKDSAVIGQASASDLLGNDRNAGRVARNFDVRDIAEATALALMEDMSR